MTLPTCRRSQNQAAEGSAEQSIGLAAPAQQQGHPQEPVGQRSEPQAPQDNGLGDLSAPHLRFVVLEAQGHALGLQAEQEASRDAEIFAVWGGFLGDPTTLLMDVSCLMFPLGPCAMSLRIVEVAAWQMTCCAAVLRCGTSTLLLDVDC